MLPGQCLGPLEIHWRGVRLAKRRRFQSGQAGETYQQQKGADKHRAIKPAWPSAEQA